MLFEGSCLLHRIVRDSGEILVRRKQSSSNRYCSYVAISPMLPLWGTHPQSLGTYLILARGAYMLFMLDWVLHSAEHEYRE